MIWLVWTALVFLVFWLAQWAAEGLPAPPWPRRTPPGPRLPHWARTGHLPSSSSSSAAVGRHRRKATR